MRAAGIGVILALVGAVLCTLVLGAGTALVWSAQSSTRAASDTFTIVLQSESAVVYQVGGDRRFEELYHAYTDAKGPARVAAAVAFADALEREMNARSALDPRVTERAERILSARDTYSEAYEAWRSTAGGFPGALAVGVGLASGPGG